MAKQDPEEVRKRLMREAAEEALAEAADNDPAVAKWLDDDFDKGMTDLFGGTSPAAYRKALEQAIPGITDKDVEAAQKAIKEARKAAEGGFFRSPNPQEAERILMSVRGIREVKKQKESKSCFIAALVLLGSASLSVWGLIEAGQALLG